MKIQRWCLGTLSEISGSITNVIEYRMKRRKPRGKRKIYVLDFVKNKKSNQIAKSEAEDRES